MTLFGVYAIDSFQLSDLHKQSVQQSLDQPDLQHYQHYTSARLVPPSASAATSPLTSSSLHATSATHAYRSVKALRIDTGEYLHEMSPPPPPSPTTKPAPSSYATNHHAHAQHRNHHQQQQQTTATPRRMKLLNFWARTRLFQKIMMVCVVLWIALIVNKAGIVQHLMQDENSTTTTTSTGSSSSNSGDASQHIIPPTIYDDQAVLDDDVLNGDDDVMIAKRGDDASLPKQRHGNGGENGADAGDDGSSHAERLTVGKTVQKFLQHFFPVNILLTKLKIQ